MADIADTLQERGKRYGKFTGHAAVSQGIQEILVRSLKHNPNVEEYEMLDSDIKEALFMIAHKLGRIVNGDPGYADSWLDIAGYAKLVADRLENGTEV